MVMPLVFAFVLLFGWRLAMVVSGAILFVTGIAYYYFTQDAPNGNYKELRAKGQMAPAEGSSWKSFILASKDYRGCGLCSWRMQPALGLS